MLRCTGEVQGVGAAVHRCGARCWCCGAQVQEGIEDLEERLREVYMDQGLSTASLEAYRRAAPPPRDRRSSSDEEEGGEGEDDMEVTSFELAALQLKQFSETAI